MKKIKYHCGLVVMRAQPPHIGHQKIINRMLQECEQIIVILGSVQEQGTDRNPFSYIQRKKMLQDLYTTDCQASRMKIIGLFDINNPTEWSNFVLDFLKESMPTWPVPEVYYAGSEYDAQWFRTAFKAIEIENRVDYDFPYVSGSMVRDMLKIGDNRWRNYIPQEIHHYIEESLQTKKGVV